MSEHDQSEGSYRTVEWESISFDVNRRGENINYDVFVSMSMHDVWTFNKWSPDCCWLLSYFWSHFWHTFLCLTLPYICKILKQTNKVLFVGVIISLEGKTHFLACLMGMLGLEPPTSHFGLPYTQQTNKQKQNKQKTIKQTHFSVEIYGI